MIRRSFGCVFVAMALVTSVVAQRKQSEIDLQAAIRIETVDLDIKAAIAQYQKVADQYAKTDRATAATALLRMAECYEKLGDARATPTYERVAKEFSDQPEAVSHARTRWAAIGGATASGDSTTGPVCVDCLTNARVALSRDGRWMAMPDVKTGVLTIRDLSTGQVTKLTDGRAVHPVFSPNARQLAYAAGGDGPHQVRVMPNQIGGKSRILIDNPEFEYAVPMAWSPDGASLLVQLSHEGDETWQTAWVSVADGRMKVLKSLDWRRRGFEDRPALSPDGRYLAYSALVTNPGKPGAAGPDAPKNIYVLAADGSKETQVTTAAGLYEFPTWSADGTYLIFKSARSSSSGPWDLWSIPVKDGKAADAPSVVKSDVGNVSLIGMAPSGSLYYVLSRSAVPQIAVATVPRGSSTSDAIRVTHRFVGDAAIWSPDGKLIATSGPPVGRVGPNAGSSPDIRISSVETGEQRICPLPSGFLARRLGVAWLHDGSAVLVEMQEVGTSSWSVGRIDVKTGHLTRLGALPEAGNLAISSDDKRLYFMTLPAERSSLSVIDLATWKTSPLLPRVFGESDSSGFASGPNPERLAIVKKDPSAAAIFGWSVSADEKTVLFVRGNSDPTGGVRTHLTTISLDDGSERELYAPSEGWISLVRRTPVDGVLFTHVVGNGPSQTVTVMRIAAAGGTPEVTGIEASGLTVSPDGSRVAYNDRSQTSSTELWKLDVGAARRNGQ